MLLPVQRGRVTLLCCCSLCPRPHPTPVLSPNRRLLQVQQMRPDHSEVPKALARLYHRTGQPHKAVLALQSHISDYPHQASWLHGRRSAPPGEAATVGIGCCEPRWRMPGTTNRPAPAGGAYGWCPTCRELCAAS